MTPNLVFKSLLKLLTKGRLNVEIAKKIKTTMVCTMDEMESTKFSKCFLIELFVSKKG